MTNKRVGLLIANNIVPMLKDKLDLCVSNAKKFCDKIVPYYLFDSYYIDLCNTEWNQSILTGHYIQGIHIVIKLC